MNKFMIFLICCIPMSSMAEDSDVLNVDRSVSENMQLAFPNDANIEPNRSEFNVLNYVLMSNDLGERFAVITLKNGASGNRGLDEKHLMALFADGTRRSPQTIKLNFTGHETQSITVTFGESKFPILAVYSNPKYL